MAQRRLASRRLVLLGCFALIHTVLGTPNVAFPFNSQVPTVARVGRPYNFQFSSSTFAPEDTNFTYSISEEPTWLSLDEVTRTLSGTPSQADTGAANFTITAADPGGTASMACTLVVSSDPPPQLEGDMPKELAATANLSSTQPPTVTVLPSMPFHFQFEQNSFIDIVRRKLYYYATLTDHTPLPAWLQFDPQTLAFSGSAPQLSAFPQSWAINLIVSDVAGFAGTTVSFVIAIGTQQLVFVPQQATVNISAGVTVNHDLQDTLFLNGKRLPLDQLQSAEATMPPWLSFNSKTLALSGTPPSDVQNYNCTVTVEDRLGDKATAVISLLIVQSTIFVSSVGTLKAHSGQAFSYHIPNTLFNTQPSDLVVTLPVVAKWLHFSSSSRVLSGQAPSQTTSSSIEATMVARSPTESKAQTQTFTIEIVPSTAKTSVAHTGNAHAHPTHELSSSGSGTHLNSGIVAAVVLGVLLAAALLAAFLYFVRRRRERNQWGEPDNETKRTISRPFIPSDGDTITVTTEVQRDVEKADSNSATQARNSDQAPRVGLDIEPNQGSRLMKWSKRFSRISQASSLGNGEDAIRGDSNIPVLGGESMAAHTPHHSFSVSTKMARASLPLGELSPTKRALRRVRAKLPGTRSIGLGIDTGNTALVQRPRSESARLPRRAASSVTASATGDRSSLGSFSTRGTSVLSARPSDFPRPPARSALTSRGARLGAARADMSTRKSIRVVERSDSIADGRSMEEKRQSFIRNRASTGIASPLFSHGSRVNASIHHSVRASGNASMLLSKHRSPRGNSGLSTYSESSSIEAPAHQPRGLGTKARYVFAPNFPRAMTKSTLGAENDASANRDSSSFYTTDGEISEPEYVAEMHLPRHQRSWVVPGEASPTPPPAPSTCRRLSSVRRDTPPSTSGSRPRAKWERRLREYSTSPTSKCVSSGGKGRQARRTGLSEPLSLVSNDSVSRAKQERARVAQKTGGGAEDARRPGSEMFEALEGAGLMPPGAVESRSQRSNVSGAAFL